MQFAPPYETVSTNTTQRHKNRHFVACATKCRDLPPILSEKGARDILSSVGATHSEAAASSQSPQRQRAVVEIISAMLDGEDQTPR